MKDFLVKKEQYLPWYKTYKEIERSINGIQAFLIKEYGATIGKDCYIADDANIYPEELVIGDRVEIAADSLIRGYINIGNDCSINPYSCISGKVWIGNDVRIASLSSIIGFNHGFDRLDIPIRLQEDTQKGIQIGNDVWIGANSVITDGVSIGNHCVIGAGAIVTKDVENYSVVVGNPAQKIRDRRDMGSSI